MKRKIIFVIFTLLLMLCACSSSEEPIISSSETSQSETSENSQSDISEESDEPKAPALPGREGPNEFTRLLGTKEELFAFAAWVRTGASYYNQALIWQLDADVDLENEPWEPIGPLKNIFTLEEAKEHLEGYEYLLEMIALEKEKNPELYEEIRAYLGFFGTFNGNGHKITGLNVLYEEGREQSGFFAVLGPGANINDLHLEGFVSGFGNTGGLVGRGPFCSFIDDYSPVVITGCSFTGTVEIGGTHSAPNNSPCGFGGLIGTSGENTEIYRCFTNAEVSGDYDVGGLVGTLNYGSTVSDCYSKGTVKAIPAFIETEDYFAVGHIGGLIGGTYGSEVVNSYSSTYLVITAESGPVGGFIGYHSGRDYCCAYSAKKTGAWGPGAAYSGTNTKFSALALTPEEMRNPQTFIDLGWDMENVWKLEEGDTTPTLR